MKLYQDKFKQKYMRDYGCVCTSWMNGVNYAVDAGLIYDDIEQIANLAVKQRAGWDSTYPVMSDGNDLNKMGAYVWDHEKLLNIILHIAGRDDKRAFYKSRQDIPSTKELNIPKHPTIIIGQFSTQWGSHFKLLTPREVDPIENGVNTIGLISLRYCTIIDI